MSVISEFSEDNNIKLSLDTETGSVTVFNVAKNEGYTDSILMEDVAEVQAMIVPGFDAGNVLYAIGYFIAKKVGAGSDAK